MKSHTILLSSAWDMNCPFIQYIYTAKHHQHISHLDIIVTRLTIKYCSARIQITLILLNSGPQGIKGVVLAM